MLIFFWRTALFSILRLCGLSFSLGHSGWFRDSPVTEVRGPGHEIQFLNFWESPGREKPPLHWWCYSDRMWAWSHWRTVLHCMRSVCLNVASRDETRAGDGERPSVMSSLKALMTITLLYLFTVWATNMRYFACDHVIQVLKLATENPLVMISYGKCINTSICFGYVWCSAAFINWKRGVTFTETTILLSFRN